MSDALTDEQVAALAGALARGKKIEAIKLYREATGTGLKEAKDFVDALAVKLVEEDPEKYAALAQRGGSGCGALVLVALAFCGCGAVALALAS